MNIFLLDTNPVLATKYHFDRHVVKMVTETAQLLSNCVEYREGETYRHSHPRHPCTIWVKGSPANFWWLYNFGLSLAEEYTYRYGKVHGAARVIEACGLYVPHTFQSPTHFAQVVPEECRVLGDPVAAYRKLYMGPKRRLANWKKRDTPWWWT